MTVDVFPDLCQAAQGRFLRLKIDNIQVLVADGSIPFTKDKVFDKIIVTASVPPMPTVLKNLDRRGWRSPRLYPEERRAPPRRALQSPVYIRKKAAD